MKRNFLILFLCIFAFNLKAQRDSLFLNSHSNGRDFQNATVFIYPVPVRDNIFTIKTDKDVYMVRITNIIGQDIYRARYNDPQRINKILLDNAKRGMYLVTIIFGDGSRVVKKIMVEESD
jgi:hypothetical protein